MDRNQAKMLIKRLIEDDGSYFMPWDEDLVIRILNLLYDNGFVIESRLIDEDDKEVVDETFDFIEGESLNEFIEE